jgi:hypothetical protein
MVLENGFQKRRSIKLSANNIDHGDIMTQKTWDFRRHEGEPYPIRISPEQVKVILSQNPPRSKFPPDSPNLISYYLESCSITIYSDYHNCGVLFPMGYGWMIIEDPFYDYPLVDLGSDEEILADPRLAPRKPSD